MKFDFSQIPTTLDILHVTLLGIIFVLVILLLTLLSAIVLRLLRKPKPVEQTKAIEAVEEKPTVQPVKQQPVPEPVILKEATPDAALQLLGLFQQEARFIDFIEEDIAAYSDTDIGAAARVVHEGCHKILHNHFDFEPIRVEEENASVTLRKGFDSSAVRLTGNIVGKAPFKGTLVHRGWRATKVNLPKIADGHNVNILASAEVEL